LTVNRLSLRGKKTYDTYMEKTAPVPLNIDLKPSNRPKTPGHYLCCRVEYSSQPFLVRLDPDMTMVGGGCVMPVTRCEASALWSDELTVSLTIAGSSNAV
jgi:hypothetical protein